MTVAVALVGGKALRNYRQKLGLGARAKAKPSALLLSGGGNLGYFHLGVIDVLLENGLLPRVISGASAGSTMAALIGTRSERELHALRQQEHGLLSAANTTIDGPVTSDSVRASLEKALPDVTFAEAQEISGRALNVSVSAREGAGGLVCGPRTTPDVLVRDAVLASCAVPRVFAPVELRQRKRGQILPFAPGHQWIDGSIYADIPSDEIKRRYGVRHTIVSMVNPLARPFLSEQAATHGLARRALTRAAHKSALGWIALGRSCARTVPTVHEAFDTVYRLVHQDYSGDLMLAPSRRFAALSTVLDMPTSETMRSLSAEGAERARARLGELQALAS